MIRPHIKKSSSAPWWAVFGAPLLGVPLLVGVLALSAPAEEKSQADVEDSEASFVHEEVEIEPTPAHVAEVRVEETVAPLARC